MQTKKWMVFVDGENFTIRGQAVAKALGIALDQHPKNWRQDVLLWPPLGSAIRSNILEAPPGHSLPAGFSPWYRELLEEFALRGYYYTTSPGDDDALISVSQQLRSFGFEPRVFHKPRGGRAKRVDITLARDMLVHGSQGHYDIAVLVAGDEDFLPLVEEVKHMGRNVWVCFFEHAAGGLAPALKLAADLFIPADVCLLGRFKK
jgi:hypothetical protein